MRASTTPRTPLLAPELTARTGLSREKAGAEGGWRGSHLVNDGPEPTVITWRSLWPVTRTLEAAIDAAERRIAVSRCTAKRRERDVPPDTGEVRSEVNLLVNAISTYSYSIE